ncbi:hypothetical protein E2C01_020641 [Portunus trituberculatus]|uniref:Uncharacterized protein n=1 Tax=Portunus trituberculatus TaxID=210409 RepID=A0A5B7E0F0_PORTR|nr:hypothetical protein [Portunus trituberculatus]
MYSPSFHSGDTFANRKAAAASPLTLRLDITPSLPPCAWSCFRRWKRGTTALKQQEARRNSSKSSFLAKNHINLPGGRKRNKGPSSLHIPTAYSKLTPRTKEIWGEFLSWKEGMEAAPTHI